MSKFGHTRHKYKSGICRCGANQAKVLHTIEIKRARREGIKDISGMIPGNALSTAPGSKGGKNEMQEFVANPVVVKAAKINTVYALSDGSAHVFLDGESRQFHASAAMCARINPKIGDYWVVQEDGYVYLNPKEVFLRKYSPRVGLQKAGA